MPVAFSADHAAQLQNLLTELDRQSQQFVAAATAAGDTVIQHFTRQQLPDVIAAVMPVSAKLDLTQLLSLAMSIVTLLAPNIPYLGLIRQILELILPIFIG